MFQENHENPLPDLSGVSYGFSTIFSIYLIQSILYIGIFFFGFVQYSSILNPDVLNWILFIYTILTFVLFISVRKYMNNYEDSQCGIFLFILFFVFKLCFFIIVCI